MLYCVTPGAAAVPVQSEAWNFAAAADRYRTIPPSHPCSSPCTCSRPTPAACCTCSRWSKQQRLHRGGSSGSSSSSRQHRRKASASSRSNCRLCLRNIFLRCSQSRFTNTCLHRLAERAGRPGQLIRFVRFVQHCGLTLTLQDNELQAILRHFCSSTSPDLPNDDTELDALLATIASVRRHAPCRPGGGAAAALLTQACTRCAAHDGRFLQPIC